MYVSCWIIFHQKSIFRPSLFLSLDRPALSAAVGNCRRALIIITVTHRLWLSALQHDYYSLHQLYWMWNVKHYSCFRWLLNGRRNIWWSWKKMRQTMPMVGFQGVKFHYVVVVKILQEDIIHTTWQIWMDFFPFKN